MKKDELEALIGHKVAEIQYDDDDEPTKAVIVLDNGYGYEVNVTQ